MDEFISSDLSEAASNVLGNENDLAVLEPVLRNDNVRLKKYIFLFQKNKNPTTFHINNHTRLSPRIQRAMQILLAVLLSVLTTSSSALHKVPFAASSRPSYKHTSRVWRGCTAARRITGSCGDGILRPVFKFCCRLLCLQLCWLGGSTTASIVMNGSVASIKKTSKDAKEGGSSGFAC